MNTAINAPPPVGAVAVEASPGVLGDVRVCDPPAPAPGRTQFEIALRRAMSEKVLDPEAPVARFSSAF